MRVVMDDVGVDVVVCDVVWWVVVDVVVDDEMDDNSAIAHCLDDGGLCFDMVSVMGTEIKARFQSQNLFLRDSHMA